MSDWVKSFALAWCVIVVVTIVVGEFMYWGEMPWVGDWSVGDRAFYILEALVASVPTTMAVHQITKARKP